MTRYRVTATKPGKEPVVFESEFMSIAIWWQTCHGPLLEQTGWTVGEVELVTVRSEDDVVELLDSEGFAEVVPGAKVIPFESRTVASGRAV